MISLSSKKFLLSILFGLVFLVGGASTVTAAEPAGAIAQADNLISQLTCTGVTDCIMQLPTRGFVYLSYYVYILSAGILTLSGYIFDAVLTLSIDKTFILKPFIDSTWILVRDFSNMAFIFVLLYTGIQTILGIGDWRKTVLNIIVIALLINFSLFFTKVVIDAGNILAVGIYSAIGAEKIDKSHTSMASGGLKERDLSSSLVGNFGPQTILGNAGKVESPYLVFAIFIIGVIVNILAAFAFFRVALVFIGRIIGFWFLMVISPFAFISITFPKGNEFHSWLKNLLGLSFVAPVFLFFLYLLMKVLAEGHIMDTLSSPSGNNLAEFSFDAIFIPVIMVIFIYLALDKAVSFSKNMAGDFGQLGATIGAAAMGAATGGAAFMGREVVGGLAGEALKRGMVSSESWVGRRAEDLTKSSFDLRNLGGKDSMFGATIGGGIAKGVGAMGIGKGGGVGGVAKAEEERVKKATDHVPKMSVFEEQGARDRAAKEAAKKQTGENVSSASAVFGAKLAKEQTAQLEADAEAAQKAHDESDTAKELAAAKATYEESVRDVMRGGSPAARDAAKTAFDKATANHATSGTSVALQKKLDELRKAKQTEQEATRAPAVAEVSASGTAGTKKDVKDPIAAENERRRMAYADKVEKGGWFGIGANPVAAAKIRKGEGSESKKDKLAKLAKEIIAEEEKEKKEAEPKKETGEADKH